MAGLTNLGIFHTAISLIAVAAGLIAFARNCRIVPNSLCGRTYVVTPVITCLTGFGIFEHGGFGKRRGSESAVFGSHRRAESFRFLKLN